MQDLGYELPRIPIPRTPVNKPPVDAPEPSQWHHAHVADSLEKTQVSERRNVYVRTGEHDIGPSIHGGTC